MSFLQRNGGYIGWKHIRGLQQSMIFSWTMYLMKSDSANNRYNRRIRRSMELKKGSYWIWDVGQVR